MKLYRSFGFKRYQYKAFSQDKATIDQLAKAVTGAMVTWEQSGILIVSDGKRSLSGPGFVLWAPDDSPIFSDLPQMPAFSDIDDEEAEEVEAPRPSAPPAPVKTAAPPAPVKTAAPPAAPAEPDPFELEDPADFLDLPTSYRVDEPPVAATAAPAQTAERTARLPDSEQSALEEFVLDELDSVESPSDAIELDELDAEEDLEAELDEFDAEEDLEAELDEDEREVSADEADEDQQPAAKPRKRASRAPFNHLPKTTRYKNITRMEDGQKNRAGYFVRVVWQKQRRSRFFADAAYGDQLASLAAALEYREASERELGKPRTEQAIHSKVSNTGHQGISRIIHSGKDVYQASWRDEKGYVHRRHFRIDLLGKRRALKEALAARAEGQSQAQNNSASS